MDVFKVSCTTLKPAEHILLWSNLGGHTSRGCHWLKGTCQLSLHVCFSEYLYSLSNSYARASFLRSLPCAYPPNSFLKCMNTWHLGVTSWWLVPTYSDVVQSVLTMLVIMQGHGNDAPSCQFIVTFVGWITENWHSAEFWEIMLIFLISWGMKVFT